MKFAPFFYITVFALSAPAHAKAKLIEYHMQMEPHDGGSRVALTFDACTGKVDQRILNALIEN